MRWAAHRHAQWYLAGLSFAESSFFPVPPDVMLAPMSLANTARAWRFAGVATFASVAGGALGYLLGEFAFDAIQPLLEKAGYIANYQLAVSWFERWGVWVVFVAGFSPIPYKLFTIAAGVVSMPFAPFMLASFIGRGVRFFLVSALMVWGGEKMESMLRKNVDRAGWAAVAVIGIAYFVIQSV
jgi:membrane protein YqaA with SNARE-associated domain